MAVPRTSNETVYTAIQPTGYNVTIGSETVVVLESDPSGNILHCTGATKPTASGAGYGRGCQFILTGTSSTPTIYFNAGSATSCNFLTVTLT